MSLMTMNCSEETELIGTAFLYTFRGDIFEESRLPFDSSAIIKFYFYSLFFVIRTLLKLTLG